MSIRLRLALWFGTVMAIALTAFGATALWLHTRWSAAQFDAELTTLGAAVAQVMQEELGESHNLRHAALETHSALEVHNRAIAIVDVSGQPIVASWQGFEATRTFRSHDPWRYQDITTMSHAGEAWRVLQRPETSRDGDYTIVVAGPLGLIAAQRTLLVRVLLVAGAIMILATSAVSWWVASSALRPVSAMAIEAAAVSAQSPDWRLSASDGTGELAQLSRAFNDLLARLSAASLAQRQFMADASHELRTPVSVIQTATEVTLDRPTRQEADYREALTIIGEQTARLGRMVQDMFLLARADVDGYRAPMQRLYIDEVVDEAVRAVAVVAAAKGLAVDAQIQPDVALDGDDGLLHRMITNLLDNAVQYTRPAGSIRIVLAADSDTATITIVDTGPGIPEKDRDRVFDRFVRLAPARSAESGGGLGLPIARWIAELHHGTLSLAPSLHGAVFVVRLPRTAAAHHLRTDHNDRFAKMNVT